MSDDTVENLSLVTPLYLRELHSGAWTAAPVAELHRMSLGREHAVREDMGGFLEVYLVEARAPVVAQYCLSPEVRLHLARVSLRREDLPAGLHTEMRLDVPCILSPQGRDTWVLVPVINHTFYVPRGQELDPAIRAEVARIVAAEEMTGDEFLALFPGREHTLESVSIELDRKDTAGTLGRAKALRQRRIEQHRRDSAVELLESVSSVFDRSLVDKAELVGRQRPLRELTGLLAGERTGVVIVGAESVGKTALFRAWRDSQSEERRVYATSAAQLIAGMSGLGEWQDRLVKVMQAVELLDAVLYFENLAELFGERPDRGGSDIPGVMRRYLGEGRVRVVGEMTPEALSHAEPRYAGLFSSLSRVQLEPLTATQTREALAAQVRWWNLHDPLRPRVDPEVVDAVVELAERYVPYRAFPGKAMRVVDELRATREQERDPSGERALITVEHAYESFSLATGIPAFLLREDQPLRRSRVLDVFRQRIVGQDEAVAKVVDNICVVKARLQPSGKPLSTLLFVGPTGVGKTEVARTLSEFLFGSAQRMIRFDMSEYRDGGAAERLIRGSEREDGLLTSRVREQPFCVLLLDEIEKAHPSVFDLLLQVCGEGRLTDARGKTTFFHNAIIIMTSNLGAAHKRAPIGIGATPVSDAEHYVSAARKTFRPEFINRMDAIVAFRQLTPEEAREVARIALRRLADRRGIQESGLALDISDGALEVVAEKGYSKDYGGRALRRYIEDHLIGPLARLLARLGPEAKGAFVWVTARAEPVGHPEHATKNRITSVDAGALRFELYRRAGASGRRALRGIDALASMRRDIDYWMQLDAAEGVKEGLAFLRSQLATARAPRKRKKQPQTPSAEIVRLQREHHRLATVWDAAAALQRDIHVAEELGMAALFDGQLLDDWVEEGEQTYRQFRRELFYLLMAQREVRDEITLALYDINGAGVYEQWLMPLLGELERRKWTLQAHVKERGYDWPQERGWGPPHDATWLETEFLRAGTKRELLLRVTGPYAGCVLGVEAGVHRFVGYYPKSDPAHLVIVRMAMRTELSNKEWLDPELIARPPTPTSKSAVAREREAGRDLVRVVERERTVKLADADYWRDIEQVAVEHLLWFFEADRDEELFPVKVVRNPDREETP